MYKTLIDSQLSQLKEVGLNEVYFVTTDSEKYPFSNYLALNVKDIPDEKRVKIPELLGELYPSTMIVEPYLFAVPRLVGDVPEIQKDESDQKTLSQKDSQKALQTEFDQKVKKVEELLNNALPELPEWVQAGLDRYPSNALTGVIRPTDSEQWVKEFYSNLPAEIPDTLRQETDQFAKLIQDNVQSLIFSLDVKSPSLVVSVLLKDAKAAAQLKTDGISVLGKIFDETSQDETANMSDSDKQVIQNLAAVFIPVEKDNELYMQIDRDLLKKNTSVFEEFFSLQKRKLVEAQEAMKKNSEELMIDWNDENAPTLPATDAPTSIPVENVPATDAPTSIPVENVPATDAPTNIPVENVPATDAPTNIPVENVPATDAPTAEFNSL